MFSNLTYTFLFLLPREKQRNSNRVKTRLKFPGAFYLQLLLLFNYRLMQEKCVHELQILTIFFTNRSGHATALDFQTGTHIHASNGLRPTLHQKSFQRFTGNPSNASPEVLPTLHRKSFQRFTRSPSIDFRRSSGL